LGEPWKNKGGGVFDVSRKHLIEKRDYAKQILKAAMAINNNVLAEIDIPENIYR